MAISRTALAKKGYKKAARLGFPKHDPGIDFIPAELTLQKHGWGKAEHYDIRVKKKAAVTWFGYHFFSDPRQVTTTKHAKGGAKGYGQLVVPKHRGKPKLESEGELRWMDFQGKMAPGTPGNPTKQFTAYMDILERKVPCIVHRRSVDHLLFTVVGKKYRGTFLVRLYKGAKGLAWTLVKLSPEKQFKLSLMLSAAKGRRKIGMVAGWNEAKEKGYIG